MLFLFEYLEVKRVKWSESNEDSKEEARNYDSSECNFPHFKEECKKETLISEAKSNNIALLLIIVVLF